MPGDNMRAEQGQSAPADALTTGNIPIPDVSAASPPMPLTPDERKVQKHMGDHSFFSVISIGRGGNGVGENGSERTDHNARFEEQLTAIRILKRDLGLGPEEIEDYENSILKLENVKTAQRANHLDSLAKERQRLAVSNFPIYISIWRKLNPEDEEAVRDQEERFTAAKGEDSVQAKMSEELREKLNTDISDKSSYFVGMLQTLLVETGQSSSSEAQIAALSELGEIEQTTSLPEKAKMAELLEGRTTYLLINSLDRTIEVWNTLHPGEGENEEIRINSSNGEGMRIESAKQLYKRIETELDGRRGNYGERLLEAYNDSRNEHPYPFIEASEKVRRLSLLPRLEQIRIMETDPGL